uniref:Uncharacterized protein n=1 Tax=Geospiza parvula TaxID=87175 RepID=A0A8C3MQE9_GEOPR
MGEAGFNTEYAAGPFALFCLAKYANITLMNTLTAILFFKPSLFNLPQELFPAALATKVLLLSAAFLRVRSALPPSSVLSVQAQCLSHPCSRPFVQQHAQVREQSPAQGSAALEGFGEGSVALILHWSEQ